MDIPLREYYSVTRAAELLECKVEDLLHWASIGAINLYVEFNEGKGHVRFHTDSDELHNKYINEIIPVMDGPSYVHSIYSENDTHKKEFFKKSSPVISSFPCFFKGFWSLPFNCFGYTSLYEIKPSSFDLWASPNKKMFVYFESDEYLYFDMTDFYIMKSDFIILKGCENMVDLPNYYNGGVLRPIMGVDKKPHIAEYHSKKRESVLKAAIYMKANYPALCENNTKWAEAINEHAHKFWENGSPPLAIDTIADLLGKALSDPKQS